MENTKTGKARLMDDGSYAFRGRFNKAHKIVRWCRRHGISSEQLMGWDADKWELMLPEMTIGKKVPSDITIGMAVAMLQPAPHRRPRGQVVGQ